MTGLFPVSAQIHASELEPCRYFYKMGLKVEDNISEGVRSRIYQEKSNIINGLKATDQ
jgi:hypothetical protein